MEVVAASAEDADAVAAIFIAARRVAMPWLPELRNVGGVPRYFADHVIGEGEVLVVRRADAPVAFLALRGDMIEHLYVRPDAQRNEEREPDVRLAWTPRPPS